MLSISRQHTSVGILSNYYNSQPQPSRGQKPSTLTTKRNDERNNQTQAQKHTHEVGQRSQKLRSRRKLGLLAEPKPVHAAPGAPRPISPPLLPPRGPTAAAATFSPLTPAAAAAVPRSPHHPLADLHRRWRVLEGEAPRDVAQVEGAYLEHRPAVGSAGRVGADVALEGRARAVQEGLVARYEELQPLLELVRQLG